MAADYLVWMLSTWLEPEQVESASPRVAALARALTARPGLGDVVARNT